MQEIKQIDAVASSLVDALISAGKSMATAESCTGGWIAKALTDISGSSQCFGYGIVSYSNEAKESLLKVNPETLITHGAVSEAVVREMAEGVLVLSEADFAVAVSGIAGPDGGSEQKPVGTVWFAWATRGADTIEIDAHRHLLTGDRFAVRSQTVVLALQGIRERLQTHGR